MSVFLSPSPIDVETAVLATNRGFPTIHQAESAGIKMDFSGYAKSDTRFVFNDFEMMSTEDDNGWMQATSPTGETHLVEIFYGLDCGAGCNCAAGFRFVDGGE